MPEPEESGQEDEQLILARATMLRLFGVDFDVEPGKDEPENVRDLNELLLKHAFADSWSRPGLDDRSKSLVTMAFLVAQGQSDELRAHISGALLLGITKAEIVELLIHALAYCGAPRTNDALKQARTIFARQT
jgi:alkylhydroperoxidase/carboxymuconolactone decarboxylase family protein YurZ